MTEGTESIAGPAAAAAALQVRASWLKEHIYATLTMLAVVVGLAQGRDSRLVTAVTIGTTAAGIWMAGLVADEQAHRVVHGRLTNRAELLRMLYVTSPLLTAAVGPLVMVAMSATGLLDLRVALYISVVVDTGSLFVWSYYAGARMGAGVLASVLAGSANVLVASGVIVVKLLAK